MNYWLFKTEPDAFSIDDLATCPKQTEGWDGIRNYQARNFLRDQVKTGDQVFIYHSSCKAVGIVGLAEVVREGYPDPSQFNPEAKYHDPKSDPAKPRWYQVDVKLIKKFARLMPLATIKAMPELQEMALVKRSRLSVQPVTATEAQHVFNWMAQA